MIKRKFIVFLGVIFAVSVFYVSYCGSKFRKEHSLTVGQIIKWDGGSGTRGNFGPLFYYYYHVNGKVLRRSRRHKNLKSNIGKIMTGKSFPVAYRKYWYGYMENIMITPEDFQSFGYQFPDSLKWILPYMEN